MKWFRNRKPNSSSAMPVEGWVKRGIELKLEGRLSDGTLAFHHALTVCDDKEKTLEAIIRVLLEREFKFEATRYAHQLRSVNYDNEFACSMLGFETSIAKQERLQAILDAAIANVQSGEAATMLAAARAAEGLSKLDVAYSYTLAVLECQRPTDPAVVLSLGDLSTRLDWFEEAERWRSIARFHGAEERDVISLEIKALIVKGRFFEAKELLLELREYPGSEYDRIPYAYALLRVVKPAENKAVFIGEAMVREGRLNEAVSHYKAAMAEVKGNRGIEPLLYELKMALALIRLGEQGGTRNDLEEMFALTYTLKPESGMTPISAGTWFVDGVIEASNSQDGSDFEGYLAPSDYEILHRYELLEVDALLVGLMSREPENLEARALWERL